MKFTYLIVNLASLSIPLIYSFHRRIRFDREWKFFLPPLFMVAFLFCIWDSIFTQLGVWGFSSRYTLGASLFNLPVEEVLFFLCIPYACVFTYHSLGVLKMKNLFQNSVLAARILAGLLAAGAIIYYDRWYPFITFLLLSIVLLALQRKKYLGRFFTTYLILLFPFFVVNGILTGTGLSEPVVWYNQAEIIGLRIITIPVEDIFFGMLLILLNVAGMEWLKEKRL